MRTNSGPVLPARASEARTIRVPEAYWAPPGINSAEQAEAGGLTDCAQALSRRKRLVILAACLGVLGALVISLMLPRVYRAVAALEIQGVNENFLNLGEIDPTAMPATYSHESYVQTQAEILQQNWLIKQIVTALKLERKPEFEPPKGYWGRAAGFFGVQSGQQPSIEYATEVARRHLKVEPAPNSRIIQIQYESADPLLAANFVNTLAKAYMEQSVEARRSAAAQIREWLSPQLQDLKNKLAKSEAELEAYTRSAGLMFTPSQESLAAERLKSIQEEYSKAQADRIAKHARYQLTATRTPESMTDNEVIHNYEIKLTDLQRELADLESIMTPQSYKVVRLKAQVTQLESALANEMQRVKTQIAAQYESARRREDVLAAAYREQSQRVSNLSTRMTHYETLKHDVDAKRQFYEAMLQKVNEAGVASAIRPSNVRLVGPAEVPLRPYRPNIPLNVAIGLFGGLVLGVGYVMLSEQANRRLRGPGDVGLYLNLPELGAIPAAEAVRPPLRRLLGGSRNKEDAVELITWHQRLSNVSESFRAILASILSAGQDSSRVLVITSPLPMEGKTTVASNLGIALADINRRVLLIDGDLRRPRLHKVFDLPNSWGLGDVLKEKNASDELPLGALVKKVAIPNLFLMPSGPSVEKVASLFYSERMGRLIRRFQEGFDHVIIDAPPCLPFADARILGQHSQGVVLVVRANHTERKVALLAAQRLLMDGVPVLGTVLNDWDPAESGNAYRYYSAR